MPGAVKKLNDDRKSPFALELGIGECMVTMSRQAAHRIKSNSKNLTLFMMLNGYSY